MQKIGSSLLDTTIHTLFFLVNKYKLMKHSLGYTNAIMTTICQASTYGQVLQNNGSWMLTHARALLPSVKRHGGGQYGGGGGGGRRPRASCTVACCAGQGGAVPRKAPSRAGPGRVGSYGRPGAGGGSVFCVGHRSKMVKHQAWATTGTIVVPKSVWWNWPRSMTTKGQTKPSCRVSSTAS